MTLSKLSQHLTKEAITLLAVSILMGCSLYPDVNTDPAKNNKATFRQDALDCAHSYPEAG